MAEIRIGEFGDTIVLHFGTEGTRINAYTLATTLSNIADAAKAANAAINPGYDIEIVVEALGAGSFKASIKAIYRGAANLFSHAHLEAIVIAVIANFVYQHTLAPDPVVQVIVPTDEVVVEQGSTRIIVPRAVHEASQKLERSPQFRHGIGQAVRAIQEDPAITSFGLSRDLHDPMPPLSIPKARFEALPAFLADEAATDRELLETTDVEILRAILERSKRRWEFVWNGMKISAPVLDEAFYDDFFAHNITIAPGDALRVRLRIRQRRAPDTGIFINQSYEVVEVLKHIRRPRQGQFDLPPSSAL